MMLWGCMGRKEGEEDIVYLLCGVWRVVRRRYSAMPYIVLYNTIRLLIHEERLQVSNSYSMVKRCDYFQIGSR